MAKRETVYELSRPSRCHNCDAKLEVGQIVRLQNAEDDREALCRKCAGLDLYEVVPSGNAALTRLATKYSGQDSYTVLKWSELWKCYERKGVMVKPDALAKARSEIK
jgi:hypothetical protein